MKVTKAEYDDIVSNLAEGFHTAFRKASDHPNAHKIWMLIKEMPSNEWGNVIDFVASGTFQVEKKPTRAEAAKKVTASGWRQRHSST